MDNEQVRVCRCCGEAETHRDGCEEMRRADPLHGPRRVWDRQKAEMTASEAARMRLGFSEHFAPRAAAELAANRAPADRNPMIEREAGEVFAWWSEKVRAEYEERARFIEYARKRFAEEMYNHGASTGKPGSIMALEALLSRSPDGLTGGGS